MNMHVHQRRTVLVAAILTLAASTLAAPVAAQEATGTPSAAGTIVASGSATVGPILEAAAEAFASEAPGIAVEVERTSSGAGIERFCNGETDLATSGRRINEEEATACAATGVAYDEFEVAFDGVAVVVNPANDAVSCLTTDQLGRLWEPGSTVRTWQDLDAGWPADPISLYGTGSQSGTYQFFTQVVVGEEGASRDDYAVTDGHPVTAERVAADVNGLGFLPFPRYVEHQDQLKLVAVDGSGGCVEPSAETIRDGRYASLSRPLYVYASRTSLGRPEVAEFLRFYLTNAATYAEQVGLVASAEDVYPANLSKLEGAITGTSAPDGPTIGGTPTS
ncbi:MAG TPA: PstS family phosphate ABC transporter substrate-binding protein [Thermomicrobiales bacterium]|nr:PstS family phosphate ABC transporter substrate-binding protein [Thermomicrobiales bacterium]